MANASASSRGFLFACGVAVLAIALACLWIASREWFSRDDFAFLAYVQQAAPWSWRDVFLPLDSRFWPFYRPLGMETYFYVGFRLFGLDAFGYFAVSLVVHFGAGALLYRIGRQLGFDTRVAIVSVILAVSRHPSLSELYYGSVFHYLISILLTLLSITCFLAYVDRRGRRWELASCVALGMALLCNEVNAATPALLVLAALGSRARERRFARRVVVAVAPQLALVALYLGFRFLLLAPVEIHALRTPALGPHVVRNLGVLLLYLFGESSFLVAVLGLAAALGVGLGASRRGRGEGGRLARRALVLLAWLAVTLAPFALLPFPQERYAMMAVAPLCLLFGALLDAFWRSYGASYPRAVEAGLLAVVLAAVVTAIPPFGVLAERAADPRGSHPRRIIQAIETWMPTVPSKARLVVLYGTPGLAAHDEAIRFRYLAYNGKVLDAVYPEAELSLRFHDLTQRPPRSVIRPGSVYFQLSPSLEVERAERALLERDLPRGIESKP